MPHQMSRKLLSTFLALVLILVSTPQEVFGQDSNLNPRGSWSDQRLEREAYEAAVKAAKDPQGFHRNVKDITGVKSHGGMTAEMAKFYLAVAAVEFTKCLGSGDSTACVQYMEGLKDPIGHIGFVLFMKTNRMTLNMAQVVSRGRINPGMASYLGLASGMMAQSVFQDMYYHPLVQQLLATSKIRDDELRKSERKRILNELWINFTQGWGKYLFDKIPSVMGLLGAAYVSHKTVQALGWMFKKSERLVKFAFKPGTARVIMRYGKNLARQRHLARAGFKYVFKGSKLIRVHPVVAIGSYMVETIIFLVWAPIIEEFIHTHWDRSKALLHLKSAKGRLTDELQKRYPDMDKVETYSKQIAEAYDEFRHSIMAGAELEKMRHLMSIQKVDAELEKKIMYYEWLIRGMDFNSDLWQLNEQEFHKSGLVSEINESADYADAFFCGKRPTEAISRSVDIAGLPLPGSWSYDYSYDPNLTYYENARRNEGWFNTTGISIDPFRVARIRGLCQVDLERMNGGSYSSNYRQINCPVRFNHEEGTYEFGNFRSLAVICRIDQAMTRHKILETGLLNGRDIVDQLYTKLDEATAKVMEKAWVQRDLMVMRYERVIREKLLEAITGREVTLNNDDSASIYGSVDTTSLLTGWIPLGMIPHYEYEKDFWSELGQEFRNASRIFNLRWLEAHKKRKALDELLEYTKQAPSQRVRSKEFFDQIPTEDWEKIVHSYREYIIN